MNYLAARETMDAHMYKRMRTMQCSNDRLPNSAVGWKSYSYSTKSRRPAGEEASKLQVTEGTEGTEGTEEYRGREGS